jgi:hypothetical protein
MRHNFLLLYDIFFFRNLSWRSRLRQGVSLKNIGDLLGHRSTESTCVYLRLNVDDLREVALPLPASSGFARSVKARLTWRASP